MDKIRIGIIGTGGISNSHVRAYKKMEDVEIVAGADIIPGKAREALDRWEFPEAQAFESAQEMLEKVELDAVSVCTYNSTHAECAIAALKAGCHVLLEKPMTVTLEDAQELRRVEKATGKILTIGFQPRYDERMQRIKEVVQSGKLGQVYYVQTGGGRRRGIPGRRRGPGRHRLLLPGHVPERPGLPEAPYRLRRQLRLLRQKPQVHPARRCRPLLC